MLNVDVVNLALQFENFLGLNLYVGSLALDMHGQSSMVTRFNVGDRKLSSEFIVIIIIISTDSRQPLRTVQVDRSWA